MVDESETRSASSRATSAATCATGKVGSWSRVVCSVVKVIAWAPSVCAA